MSATTDDTALRAECARLGVAPPPDVRDGQAVVNWERALRHARLDALTAHAHACGEYALPRTGDDGRCASCGAHRPLGCAGLCGRCNDALDRVGDGR